MSAAEDLGPDALDLHAIGRLVLSAGIGPRWDLEKYRVRSLDACKVEVVTCQDTRETRLLELWSDRGPSTRGAREVAERFLEDLGRAGFMIVRGRR
jgi:hypothetical protein